MITKKMYKYERAKGKFTVAFSVPENKEYEEIYRLIAEEGKSITKDGIELFCCVDTDTIEGYYEIETPIDESEEMNEPD